MKNIIVFGEVNDLTKPLINAAGNLGCLAALAVFADGKDPASLVPFRYQCGLQTFTDWSDVVLCVGTNSPHEGVPAIPADKDVFMRQTAKLGLFPAGPRVELPIPAGTAAGGYKVGNFRYHLGGWHLIVEVTPTTTTVVEIPPSFWERGAA